MKLESENEAGYASALIGEGSSLEMSKNYKYYQKHYQSRYPKHIGPNKRDKNGNIIYYESLSSNGYIIQHFQEYDSLNRRISYRDSQGTYTIL